MGEIKKYRKIIIPKGTLFFRKALDNNVYETMFFSFDAYVMGSGEYLNKPTQVWIAKKEIISSYIIKNEQKSHFILTDLDYLYELFCGVKEDYLNLKHRDNPKRKDFLNFLKRNGIDTWVTSVENTKSLEFHIFSDLNNEIIEFKEYINMNNLNDYDKINSLNLVLFEN